MKIGIIGLGLMGGSFARAVKRKTDIEILGFDLQEESLARAVLIGAIDAQLNDNNIKDIEILFISLPYKNTIEVLNDVLPKLSPGTVVVDIVGVKRDLVKVLKKKAEKHKELEFISTHPMAGREFSGISHSAVDLYQNAHILIIPVKNTINGMAKLKAIYDALEVASFKTVSADEHDKYIAYTSQLPHLVSNAYILNNLSKTAKPYSAGSFRDFTRVAKISSTMWPDLMLHNKDYLIEAVDNLIENLTTLRSVIDKGDKELLGQILEKGNQIKINIEKKSIK